MSPAYYGITEEEIAAKQEQERLTAERVDRLQLAADVRREFVVSAYGTAKAKTLFVEALRAVAVGVELTGSVDLDDLLSSLGGSNREMLAGAGEDRLRRTLVAKLICRQEHNLDLMLERLAGRYVYGLDEQAVIDWYDRLTTHGYPLTDDERLVLDELTAKLTAHASDEDLEQDADEPQEDPDDDRNARDGNYGPEPVGDGAASHDATQVTADADPEAEDVQAADVEGPQAVEVSFGGADGSDDEDDLSRFEDAA